MVAAVLPRVSFFRFFPCKRRVLFFKRETPLNSLSLFLSFSFPKKKTLQPPPSPPKQHQQRRRTPPPRGPRRLWRPPQPRRPRCLLAPGLGRALVVARADSCEVDGGRDRGARERGAGVGGEGGEGEQWQTPAVSVPERGRRRRRRVWRRRWSRERGPLWRRRRTRRWRRTRRRRLWAQELRQDHSDGDLRGKPLGEDPGGTAGRAGRRVVPTAGKGAARAMVVPFCEGRSSVDDSNGCSIERMYEL